MAGQWTFTKGPDFHLERACMRLTMTSFPVPLSPRTRTGTSASITLRSFSWICFIAAVRPKMISSGGRSPADPNIPRLLTTSLPIANNP